jgi:hypothetical protein
MFMLWAIPAGILVGLLVGGRLSNLSGLGFRWGWLAVGGLLVQLVLFTPTGEAIAGSAGSAIYLASTLVVFVAVLRNISLPGMPLVLFGALSNLLAIAANGGYMPASADAIDIAGLPPGDHANSVVLADPALRPLTDVLALPAWVPMANVFSIGDVLIAVGIVWVIAAAMRRAVASDASDAAAAAAEMEG